HWQLLRKSSRRRRPRAIWASLVFGRTSLPRAANLASGAATIALHRRRRSPAPLGHKAWKPPRCRRAPCQLRRTCPPGYLLAGPIRTATPAMRREAARAARATNSRETPVERQPIGQGRKTARQRIFVQAGRTRRRAVSGRG